MVSVTVVKEAGWGGGVRGVPRNLPIPFSIAVLA